MDTFYQYAHQELESLFYCVSETQSQLFLLHSPQAASIKNHQCGFSIGSVLKQMCSLVLGQYL
jgi:hypothetical protein